MDETKTKAKFASPDTELIIYELKVTASSDPDLEFIDDLHTTAKTAAQHACDWLAEHLGIYIDVEKVLSSPNLRNGARFDEHGRPVEWSSGGAVIKIRERLVKM